MPATSSKMPIGTIRLVERLVSANSGATAAELTIFCSPATMNSRASNRRPITAAITDMASLSPASARPAAPAINARRADPCRSELRESHSALAHVLAGAVGIADLAWLVALQEQELAGAFVGIDFGRKRRRVGEFQRHVAFPLGLQRRDVHDDSAAGISRFAQADHQHVTRDAEVFDRAGQDKAVGRNHADVGLAIDERVR